jgi:hypothetical protein
VETFLSFVLYLLTNERVKGLVSDWASLRGDFEHLQGGARKFVSDVGALFEDFRAQQEAAPRDVRDLEGMGGGRQETD